MTKFVAMIILTVASAKFAKVVVVIVLRHQGRGITRVAKVGLSSDNLYGTHNRVEIIEFSMGMVGDLRIWSRTKSSRSP